jgi:hypothetical protein
MVNKLPVKKLIEFLRLPEKRQRTFVDNLNRPKKPSSKDGGGDYWVRSISALARAYYKNDNTEIKKQLEEISNAYQNAKIERTRTMHKRNLEILHAFVDFDFSVWRPVADFNFLKKPQILLNIKDIPIQVLPHHVFSYSDENQISVGGIWFVVWLDGYLPSDLEIYAETLFRYLSLLYSKEYKIDPKSCLIVDAAIKKAVSYQQVLDSTNPSLLESTIDSFKKYFA